MEKMASPQHSRSSVGGPDTRREDLVRVALIYKHSNVVVYNVADPPTHNCRQIPSVTCCCTEAPNLLSIDSYLWLNLLNSLLYVFHQDSYSTAQICNSKR